MSFDLQNYQSYNVADWVIDTSWSSKSRMKAVEAQTVEIQT